MALIAPYMQKFGTTTTSAGVTLTAKTGESLRVLDIHVHTPANNFVEVLIDNVSQGFFRVAGNLGNHLPFRQKSLATITGAITSETGLSNCDETMIGFWRRKGWFVGYPVAEGQTLTVREYGSTTPTANILIEYAKYEGGDIKADEQNGSDSKNYIYCSYGRPASVLAVDTTTILGATSNPAEYPLFPWIAAVPANRKFTVRAIAGSPTAKTGDGSNQGIYTKYLKLIQDRTVLYDDDRNGLLFQHKTPAGSADAISCGPGWSMVGGISSIDRSEPFVPPEPLEFLAGQDLDIYITTVHEGSTAGTPKTVAVADAEICLILQVESGA